jgi:hypothetical protein
MSIITILKIDHGHRYLVKLSDDQRSRVINGPLTIAGYMDGIPIHDLDCDPQTASWIGSEPPQTDVDADRMVVEIEEYLSEVDHD